MTYPELETLRLERVGPVGWLINNRPDQLNAMNALMRDEFEPAWRALDAWRSRVEPALAQFPSVGFASPFLRTIPGTDAYVDDI